MKKVYALKGRSFSKPLVLLVGDKRDLGCLARDITENARELIEKFWPGALTIIFNASALVSKFTGRKTVGVRMPQNRLLRDFLAKCGRPLATTSANKSGEKSARTFAEAKKIFSGKVDLIFRGSGILPGRESTIIDVTVHPCRILREGAISKEKLLEYM